jgi:hypothetical protein
MKNYLFLTFFSLALAVPCFADSVYKPSPRCIGCPEEIVLETRLAQAIEIFDCKAISGMTCRIGLRSDAKALPSEIFIQSFDVKGRKVGRPIRLIYPELKKGEKGWATFRIERSSEFSLRLTARWDGPWKNPY